MRNFIYLLFFFVLILSGCISTGIDRPDWVHQVNWEREVDPAVETQLWDKVLPYRSIEYEQVDITTSGTGDVLMVGVTGRSSQTPYLDIYEFTYEDNEMVMTGYLLEAIPYSQRNKAIQVAVRDETIIRSMEGPLEEPTVRRILPETSAKFYEPKTLLSVTWIEAGISALVDIETERVVDIWIKNEEG